MKQRIAVFAGALALIVLAAAPAGAATLYAPLYFAPADNISAWNTAPDGSLTQLAGSPFEVGGALTLGLTNVAFTPEGNRAAVGFSGNGGAQGLNVDAAGALTAAQGAVGIHEGQSIAVSPDGKFAYHGLDGPINGVDAYSIDAAGVLTTVPGSPFSPGTDYTNVAMTPNGKYLYAVQNGGIRPFLVSANGALTQMLSYAFPGADTINISSDGRFLIATTYTTHEVRAFAINSDGTLSFLGSPVQFGSTSAGSFAVSADGSRVYIGDYNGFALGGPRSVNTYAVAPDGVISFVGAGRTGDERVLRVTLSPDGRFVYAGSGNSGNILVAPIGANGLPGDFRQVGVANATPVALAMSFRPVQSSTAEFSFKTGVASRTLYFDGSASVFPAGASREYGWSFGDGATGGDGSPTIAHKFAKAGVYDVALTAFGDGCGTGFVYDSRSTVCNGAPSANKSIRIDTPPWIENLKLSPKTLKRSSKIKFKLTEKATVSLWVEKPTKGRLVGAACKKQTSKNKKAKKCTRWVRASKTFKKSSRSGNNTVKFRGKVGSGTISNGSYRLAATAIDAAKGKSPLVTVKFKIKK